jgi:hypothetical protein
MEEIPVGQYDAVERLGRVLQQILRRGTEVVLLDKRFQVRQADP